MLACNSVTIDDSGMGCGLSFEFCLSGAGDTGDAGDDGSCSGSISLSNSVPLL